MLCLNTIYGEGNSHLLNSSHNTEFLTYYFKRLVLNNKISDDINKELRTKAKSYILCSLQPEVSFDLKTLRELYSDRYLVNAHRINEWV